MSREHYLDGGLNASGNGDTRTDCYLEEHPDCKAMDLHFVSGDCTFCLVAIAPADLLRLADFLKSVAEEVAGKAAYLRDHKI